MKQTSYVYLAIVGVYTGQQILASLIAPLSREVGLSALELGVILTTSSVAVVVSSPVWGRVIGRRGHRTVLVSTIAAASASLLAFAITSDLAMRGVLTGALAFLLLLLFRGVMFGVTQAATPIAAQAQVVSSTTTGGDRIKGFAMIGASFGLAGVIGPALGSGLASHSLRSALYVPPFLLLFAAGLLALRLKPGSIADPADAKRRDSASGGTATGTLRVFDRRLWPFLILGLVVFLSLSFQAILLGFVLQDRFGLGAQATARQTGIAFLVSGVASLVTQLAVVRRLAWAPRRLLLCGLPLSLVGFLVLIGASRPAEVVVATGLVGVGNAFAIPGYSAGPTLLVADADQPKVAAATSATNNVASILGPTAATALYGTSTHLPYILCACLLGVALVFVLAHPTIRARPKVERETVAAEA